MDLTNANEPQKAAIMHLRGPCLVLAGPGSGKTYTITNRILYLLEQGVPPESVLVITFMKEAALSMQNRFREMAAADYSSRSNIRTPHAPSFPVNFGTFHSVFYHILKESNTLKSTELLSNSEKKNLILPILKTYAAQQETQEDSQEIQAGLNDDAVQILSAIGFYKNTMELEAAGKKAPARWQARFADICRDYGQAVKRMGRLDFDDMLYECKVLLEEQEDVRNYWQRRFRYILIDEFQDINPVQYEAVKLLAASPYNIFAVGDDDQAIYGFRGSQPECLKRFAAEYRARQLLLDVNYRSKEEIVRASLEVIEVNRDRFVKQLKAAPGNRAQSPAGSDTADCYGGKGPVTVRAYTDKEGQYSHMLKEIAACLGEGESCAVLFRTNSFMQGFAARLKAADILYEMKERVSSIYEHFIVTDIMAYLQLACGEGRREHILRVMNKPSRYISREAVGEGAWDASKMLDYYRNIQMPGERKNGIKNEIIRLDKQLKSIRELSLRPAVSYILKVMGYEQYLKEKAGNNSEKWQEWQELLEWLKEDASAYANLKEWKDFQREYTKAMEKGQAAEGRQPGKKRAGEPAKDGRKAVQLLTVHGAKGLEFDRVWIPDCNEKVFPHGTMPDEAAVEEERRIFYVAMTRAKKRLELLYLTGTKERPRQPSRFLNPLFGGKSKKTYSSTTSSNSQLSRYSSKASATRSYSSSSSI